MYFLDDCNIFFTCSFVVCWWQHVLYSMLLCTLSPPVLCSVQSFLFQDLPSVELSGDSFIYIFALSLITPTLYCSLHWGSGPLLWLRPSPVAPALTCGSGPHLQLWPSPAVLALGSGPHLRPSTVQFCLRWAYWYLGGTINIIQKTNFLFPLLVAVA